LWSCAEVGGECDGCDEEKNPNWDSYPHAKATCVVGAEESGIGCVVHLDDDETMKKCLLEDCFGLKGVEKSVYVSHGDGWEWDSLGMKYWLFFWLLKDIMLQSQRGKGREGG